MPTISKSRKQKQAALAKARANNSLHAKHVSLNDALIESQLEMNDISEDDVTPEDLTQYDEPIEVDQDLTPDLVSDQSAENDFDITPEDLSPSDDSQDPNFEPLPAKLMVIPDTFLALLMQNVACSVCNEKGRILPNVTKASGFHNELIFTCRCKHSFSMPTFPDTDINAVLIRNIVANGIPKQAFQRFLQVGNFGANENGKEVGINLASRQSRKIYTEQNQVIIDSADQIHRREMDRLVQANKPITISTDMCYAKRGYHSPVGHAALIIEKEKTVIDAITVKRASRKSENAYGDIQNITANKLEQYGIIKMLKHAIPFIGPMIEEIHLDQDARLQKAILEMKWEPEDVEQLNKWTGRKEIDESMIGQNEWGGKLPKICFDKVIYNLFSIILPKWLIWGSKLATLTCFTIFLSVKQKSIPGKIN